MKTPPWLLGVTVAFWGWQSGFPVAGLILGALAELPQFVNTRWEFSDDDFNRLWTLCSVLALAAAVYAFTSNEGPAMFGRWFAHPSFHSQQEASTASARAGATLLRWLPLPFYLFVMAQVFNTRQEIPLTAISLLLRWRLDRAKKRGGPMPTIRSLNVTYPYVILCLFGASASPGGLTFFWGLSALAAWALWPMRSRRFGIPIWATTMALAIGCAFFGQNGFIRTERALENYSPGWFAALLHRGADPGISRTQIGQIGRIKQSGSIILRIRTKNNATPPYYFREAAYRDYRTPVWTDSGLKNQFSEMNPEADGSTWLLPRGDTNLEVNVACYLPGGSAVLPLPNGSGRLENLPVSKLEKNGAGDVRATGPGLVIFDALYGHGPGFDAPPDTNDLSLARLEPKEIQALDKVITELNLPPSATDLRKLSTLSAFFQDKFTYGAWIENESFSKTYRDPLSGFLLGNRRGHCEYFATTTVLLLRRLGIPARYATGFAVHENTGVGRYVARGSDAHAWCLVWRDGRWQDFDTTPASWEKTEASRLSGMQFLLDWWSQLWFQFSRFRWSQGHLRQYLLWSLAPLLLYLLYRVLFKGQVRRRGRNQSGVAGSQNAWPGLDSEFYKLEKELAARGFGRESGEPLSAWIQRLAKQQSLAGIMEILPELVRLHYRHRFDPAGLDAPERNTLRQKAEGCAAALLRLPRSKRLH